MNVMEVERRRRRMRYLRQAAELESYLIQLDRALDSCERAAHSTRLGRNTYSSGWQGEANLGFDTLYHDLQKSKTKVDRAKAAVVAEVREKINRLREKADYYS
ncbi:hypothetical protein KO561_17220 [Radiobacillus kanasensis]|uniref:hypothetical protein n=1 Tax=Radiobacillus kanasensis TaxID=2844358 RepID=UPI001E44A297|nr:hypothetical protein [Radiobacillus kanasensis]UFT98913.1 hypothetical protein KO561_17220 [Radiobacillus kanasensis]